MNDRELLEAAARAAGLNVDCWDEDPFDPEYGHNHKPAIRLADFPRWWWNPLADDGDALRLAVKIGMRVDTFAHSATTDGINNYAQAGERDGYAATRRAITRAAAALAPTGEGEED